MDFIGSLFQTIHTTNISFSSSTHSKNYPSSRRTNRKQSKNTYSQILTMRKLILKYSTHGKDQGTISSKDKLFYLDYIILISSSLIYYIYIIMTNFCYWEAKSIPDTIFVYLNLLATILIAFFTAKYFRNTEPKIRRRVISIYIGICLWIMSNNLNKKLLLSKICTAQSYSTLMS